MTNIRRTALCGAAIVLVAAALSGCSFGPKATEQPATYDLGAPRNHTPGNPGIAVILALPEFTAPAWLAGNGIVYRLNYDNASRTESYAMSRWAAPPPVLLTHRVRSRFAAATSGIVTSPDGVRADYLLRIDLEDFSQSFDAPASSRVALRARATLVNLASRTLIAQRVFAFEQAAPTPDASGAVQALGAASEEFIENLVSWTEERLRSPKAKQGG